jgi:hypothetical protein
MKKSYPQVIHRVIHILIHRSKSYPQIYPQGVWITFMPRTLIQKEPEKPWFFRKNGRKIGPINREKTVL